MAMIPLHSYCLNLSKCQTLGYKTNHDFQIPKSWELFVTADRLWIFCSSVICFSNFLENIQNKISKFSPFKITLQQCKLYLQCSVQLSSLFSKCFIISKMFLTQKQLHFPFPLSSVAGNFQASNWPVVDNLPWSHRTIITLCVWLLSLSVTVFKCQPRHLVYFLMTIFSHFGSYPLNIQITYVHAFIYWFILKFPAFAYCKIMPQRMPLYTQVSV